MEFNHWCGTISAFDGYFFGSAVLLNLLLYFEDRSAIKSVHIC